MKILKFISLSIAAIVLFTVVFLSACKDNYDFGLDKLSTDVEISPTLAAPIAFADLTLADLIEDDDHIRFEEDNTFTIVYREDSLFSFEVSDFYESPTIDPIHEIVNLGELELDDIYTIKREISIRELFVNMGLTSPPAGSNLPFPAISPPIYGGEYDFNIFDGFERAELSKGTLTLNVVNNYPVTTNFTLMISTLIENTKKQIGSTMTFSIPPGGQQTKIIDLAGEKLTNHIFAKILSFSTPGGNNLTVDPDNDKLQFNISLEGLKAQSGTATFSSQSIPKDDTEVDLGNEADRLRKIILTSGKITLNIRSEIHAEIEVKLTFPTMKVNGQIREEIFSINHTGSGSPMQKVFDLANCEIDLTQGSDKNYNVFPITYDLGNKKPRQYVSFTADDKIYVDATFEDLDFYYIEGYLNTETIDIDPGDIDLDIELFDEIEGKLYLTEPIFNILVENSIGIPTRVNLDFESRSKNGETQKLNAPLLNIPYPADSLVRTVTDIISVDKQNSSIVDFVALPPQYIHYEASGTANPAGTETVNFAFNDSRAKVGFEMELPSTLKTDGLIVQDTVDVSIGEEIDNSEWAVLYIKSINGFPLDADLEVIIYDSETNQNLKTIVCEEFIKSGTVTAGKVLPGDETNHIAEIELDKNGIENLINADKLIIKATFRTYNAGTKPATIYTDCSLYVKVSIKAQLSIKIDE
jgi:hypothetical protein